MNIQFPANYRGLINIAAKSHGKTVESFVIETVVQTAKHAIFEQTIANEIDLFINDSRKDSRKNIWSNIKKAFCLLTKALLNPDFIAFVFASFIFLIALALKRNYQGIDIFTAHVCLILFLVFLFLALISFCETFLLEERSSKNSQTSMFLRLKKSFKISKTDMFANKLAKKYSVEELETAESDLKEIIVNLENSQNKLSAASILIAILLLWSIRYYSDIMFDYLIDTFPNLVGNVSFVFFITALLTFISKIDYFNDLIFYKQALSGLQKAQKIDKKG